jgi:Ca2+-binding EF-hand superfamily protein
VILDFQLKSHESFLAKFIEVFRKVDKDQNGIVDEMEIKNLVRLMDPDSEFRLDIDEVLEVMDPFSNNIMTFSSCITFFSSVRIF